MSIDGGIGFGNDFSFDPDTLDDTEFAGQGTPHRDPEPITLEPNQDLNGDADADPYTVPDPSTIGGAPRRPRGAAAYERKLRAVFASAIKITATRPGTVPDSAALILYSPKIAHTWGELAAHDPRIARGIDLLFDGTENPYLNAGVAAMTLLAQVARNHEPVLEPRARGIKLPFLRRTIPIPFKLGIRIGAMRNVTHEPKSLADYVFSNPAVQEGFARQEIPVAWRGSRR